MNNLHFDIRDIFKTPRLALSGKKIWVNLIGLMLGWAVYTVLTYLAFIVDGYSIAEIWNQFHFFPCIFLSDVCLPWYSVGITGIGMLFWFILFMLTSLAVSRITFKQLKGDEFFSSGDSYKYIKKHGFAVIMAPLSILIIIAFFIGMALLAALIAKVPVLDILFLGLPYLIYFFVATFVVYTAIVFAVSLVIAPAVVGAAEEDTMETVFQSYSTLWAQPWRLLTYEILIVILSAVATFIFAKVLIISFQFFNMVFGLVMGDKLDGIIETAKSFIFGVNSPLTPLIAKCLWICNPASANMTPEFSLSVTQIITVVFITFFLFIIAGTVISYLLTNFSVGQTLLYVVLRKKKDDENLITRKDEDELEEEEDESENSEFPAKTEADQTPEEVIDASNEEKKSE